ncbi:hypothetical protein L209DRAFT_687069 [Thermothelomyces heterothallicus CBS 203.75]
MRSIAVSLPVLSGILAIAMAGELPLTPVATYPPGRPSVFVLTQVPAKPTHTGTPTSPEKCSQVAARITPKLTPRPTYPPSLKSMADKLGGVDRDTCGEMDFRARFRSAGLDELNRFNQARHSTFIVPIWAMVGELWAACGEQARKMPQVAQEPCYRWALELSKSSNASFGGGVSAKGNDKGDSGKAQQLPDGLAGKFQGGAELEAGAAAYRGVSQAVGVGAVGAMTLIWLVLLA